MTETIHRSGYVIRWHSNPDMAKSGETLAHHHGQVAQIIFEFHPNPSMNLIYEALHHDVGEVVSGDMGAETKRGNPKLANMLAGIEAKARLDMGCPVRDLTDQEATWLKFADRLQSYRHMMHTNPDLDFRKDWQDACDRISMFADHLGISEIEGIL